VPARVREEAFYFLEILALTAFAFAQPLLDVFGRSPETFAFHGAGTSDIVLFALIVSLVPPLVVAAVAAIGNAWGPEIRRWVQTAFVAVLFGVLLLVMVQKGAGLHGVGLVLLAVAGAIGFGALYTRVAPVRTWLRFASAAPLLFVLLFLFGSGVSQLMSVGGGASADVGGARTPVVVLVLDELPTASFMRSDGSIDAGLFPGFAELGSDATWYRNATTVALRTFYAVPAILTGRFPHDDVVPVAGTYPFNLFTLLGVSYDVHAHEALTRLCPSKICGDSGQGNALNRLLDQARDVWSELVSPSGAARDPNETLVEEPAGVHDTQADDDPRFDFNASVHTPARFEQFLADMDGDAEGSLDFVHVVLPHSPFQYYPSGALYEDQGAPEGRGRGIEDTWTRDSRVVRLLRQRHLLQLQFVDTLITRMIDRLREERMYDDALVIVTADHGIAFRPGQSSRGGNKEAVQPSWPEMAFVPLFVKAPHQEGGEVSDANVETIDIVPTVADYLGITLPWEVDGRSVRGKPRARDGKMLYTSNAIDGMENRGARHHVNGAAGAKRVRAVAVDTFVPPGDPKWAVYRTGPFPDLVGAKVSEVAIAAPAGPVNLAQPGRFDRAAPRKGRVPGVLFGTLDPTIAPGAPVACAINGTIAGVSPRFNGSRSDFAIIPPDWLWRDGSNDVACYLVRNTGGAVEMLPLTAVQG
jgi:hypothetical protein